MKMAVKTVSQRFDERREESAGRRAAEFQGPYRPTDSRTPVRHLKISLQYG